MTKIFYLGSVIWLSFFVLPAVAADCGSRPDKPQLPDGAIAGPEEMKNGLESTGEYTSALEEYAACLVSLAQKNEDELSRLLQEISSAEKALNETVDLVRSIESRRDRLITEAQAAVEERNVLVQEWNEAAQSFKARLED
ncbi:MAG: hypothetical protein VX884_02920 [Pseudomonadota bacterium]|nr:hypothetical protein [Pseudomonadota bacterium]